MPGLGPGIVRTAIVDREQVLAGREHRSGNREPLTNVVAVAFTHFDTVPITFAHTRSPFDGENRIGALPFCRNRDSTLHPERPIVADRPFEPLRDGPRRIQHRGDTC